jgi:hypothetical protein
MIASYLLILPLVHIETQRKLRHQFHRWTGSLSRTGTG